MHDGLQEPAVWLEDYLTPVNFQRGNKITAMQCLQLQLKGSARAWLKSLPSGSINSREDLIHDFVQNF
jgi:hypothetical protein